jgi:hypothetical protein
MDSVSVLSDAELQNELSIFANAQFTYDIAPGVALAEDDIKNDSQLQQQFNSRSKPSTNNKQPNMHSLLNVKLASLVDNNYHTTMTPGKMHIIYIFFILLYTFYSHTHMCSFLFM